MEYVAGSFDTTLNGDGTLSTMYMTDMAWPSNLFFTRKFKKLCQSLDIECKVVPLGGVIMKQTQFHVTGELEGFIALQKTLKCLCG